MNTLPAALSPAARSMTLKNIYAIVLDAALGVSEEDIIEAHQLQYHEWVALRDDEVFKNQVFHTQQELAKDGVSFRTKARLIAEALLEDTWGMIKDGDTPDTVKADLIKSVVRWAKYDNNKDGEGGGIGAFQLNIHLGRD